MKSLTFTRIVAFLSILIFANQINAKQKESNNPKSPEVKEIAQFEQPLMLIEDSLSAKDNVNPKDINKDDKPTKELVFVRRGSNKPFVPSDNQPVKITLSDKTAIEGNGFKVLDDYHIEVNSKKVSLNQISEFKIKPDQSKGQKPAGFWTRVGGLIGMVASGISAVLTYIVGDRQSIGGAIATFMMIGVLIVFFAFFFVLWLSGLLNFKDKLRPFSSRRWVFRVRNVSK